MDKSRRLEIKVGIFIAAGLILLAVLLLQFSKSSSILRSTYHLHLHTPNVGGIKPRAGVQLAGVQVGTVSDIVLAKDGKSVTINLTIYKDFVIFQDAQFVIEQEGILGDKYVAIIPTGTNAPALTDGADVSCANPFDIQEVERSAAGLIQHVDETVQKLNESVTDFKRVVLNEQSLTNFALAISNLRTVSEKALNTVSGLDSLVTTNRAQVDQAVSNLVYFSHQLNGIADTADSLLASNGVQIAIATKNLADSSATVKSVISDVQSGKGLAGTILQNQILSSNVQAIAANLAVTTSNLNQEGLWRILWAPKHAAAGSTGTGGASHSNK